MFKSLWLNAAVLTKSYMALKTRPGEGSMLIRKVRHQLPCQADVLLINRSEGSQRFLRNYRSVL